MERQAALQAAQAGSSQDPNQDGGVTEEMIRNLQQVGISATHLLLNSNWCDEWRDWVYSKMSWLLPLIVSGGKKCGGAAADGSEGKHSPA